MKSFHNIEVRVILDVQRVKPQKNMTVPIPQSLLRRVKELANIHPYPRERKLDAYEDETSVSQSSKASN